MKTSFTFLMTLFFALSLNAADAALNTLAPDFKLKTQEGKDFDLSSRKGSWTVLYFYPKAETPGCTTQACAFRDDIEKIRKQGAEVFGISVNNVEEQLAFYKKHNLNFTLLADADAVVTKMYGAKMPVLKMSKRWTYIIDPELKIRAIDKDVDPVKDAQNVAQKISDLKK